MALLSIRNVGKKFSGLEALKDVSLEVERGEIVGIIGPNGSGKTTLINLITGILPPSSGDIVFDGRSLVGCRPHEIARLGIGRTFQQIRLFDHLSVLENVIVGMDHLLDIGYFATLVGAPSVRRGEAAAREEAFAVLNLVRGGLPQVSTRPASALPYADKRRLEIVRALAMSPRLLLLDEPAAGMAPHEMRDLVADLKQLNSGGAAIVLIEHKMRVVEGVTDRVIVLDHGQKIAEGEFQSVRRDPHVIEAYLGRGFAGVGTAAS